MDNRNYKSTLLFFCLQALLRLGHGLSGIPTPFGIDIVPQFGHVCAFGDVDGDRNTDILVFRNSFTRKDDVELAWLTQDEKGSFKNDTTINLPDKDLWTEPPRCAVGDFDGMSSLDLLISRRNGNGRYDNLQLYLWEYNHGDIRFKRVDLCSFKNTVLLDEPMLLDINGDGLADILGITEGNRLYCRLGGEQIAHETGASCYDKELDCAYIFAGWDENFKDRTVFTGAPWIFTDLTGDLSAELLVPSFKKDGSLMIDVWERKARSGSENMAWGLTKLLSDLPPSSNNFYGAPFIGDFNGDARMEIAIPVCGEKNCETVTSLLFLEIVCDGSICHSPSWDSVAFDMVGYTLVAAPNSNSRVLFRVGDFNLDGFPDLVATFKQKDSAATSTKIIGNEECQDCQQNRTRKFSLRRTLNLVEPWEAALGSATLSTFFDLKEDGNLDILVEYDYPKDSADKKRKLSFIPSTEKDDTTFLKVQTYTNVCDGKHCRDGSNKNDDIGSGITWAGVCVRFEMTDSWTNGKKEGVSCQLSSTTHRSLTIPYALFGLGRSPNFVDRITLGSPRAVDTAGQSGYFLQLVPNSRIIVIPPRSGNTAWTHRLFVTPSQLIIQSLIVLASVCLFLLTVVVILHIRERQEDRLERLAQSHRFHFDAM